MTLSGWPEASEQGREGSHHFFYHLVVLLGVMEYAAGEIDRELVFPFLLYEG